ncbi:spermatogenesis-associated protein 31E1-like [Peromyscus eremicus]|uniref:spermatogenesis-associated protein 31E1-like n=1 Tax=Peromyscus eremicus TaxID=42410 RepID=UPI0027DDFC3F|nr:spermatogenesis-associated protein 31E1-like [Peromyscus eremicus]
MENFLFLLESVDTTWLTPSFTIWAMDMILAFVCGMGLFHLLLPLLHLNSLSPPSAENITAQKVVKREHSKVRKKIRTAKAYRSSRKKPKGDEVLISLVHSMLERLVNTISICQLLRQDASGEASKPEATKAHQPPRQPTEKSVATNLSLEASSTSLKEYLLPKDSKILSHVLMNSSASIKSQLSVSASQPPETLTHGRRHSPPQAPSHHSHAPDPVAYSPSMPDPRMKAPWLLLNTTDLTEHTAARFAFSHLNHPRP